MKNVVTVCLLVCLALSLAGCVHYGVHYQCMGTADLITEIAVFDLRDESIVQIDDDMVPVGYVNREEYAAFVGEVESFPFVEQLLLLIAPTDPSFAYGGYVVRITYEDESYELIGTTGYQSQHRDGAYVGGSHFSCDEDRWNQLVLRYMDPV